MTDVLGALDGALDSGLPRPCLAADVELVRFTRRGRGSHGVIHNPRSGTYVRLSGGDADLAASLDGSRGAADLGGSDRADRDLGPDVSADLVALLRRGGFLTTPWVDTDALQCGSEPESRSRRVWRRMKAPSIEFRGVHRLIDALYNSGGRLLFTLLATVGLLVALAGGVVAFVAESRSGEYTLLGEPTAAAAATVFGLHLVAVMVHELAHALAIRHARRRVLSAGFELYMASPTFFIDSSDMVMAGRRQRAVNAVAGPYAGFVVAATAALGAAVVGPSPAGEILFRLAGITFLFNVVNLVPFLELDGYWLLTDLIDEPDLRPRSLSFLRHDLPDRVRSREPLTSGEWGLVLFGVLAVVFTVAALGLAWLFWWPVVSAIGAGLWDAGPVGRVVLVLLAALALSPLLHGLANARRATRRWIGDRADTLRFRAQRSWRIEAGEMIAALPYASGLSGEELNDLAGRVDRRMFAAGTTLVRQGDTADQLYLIRTGRCSVIERPVDGSEPVVTHLSPGSSFGEPALDNTPHHATVRADTRGQAFTIDAATFQRVLAHPLTSHRQSNPPVVTQV